MTLSVTQIDHVSVLATDLRRSRYFYGEVLGLREIAKPRTFDFEVLWFDLGSQQLHLLKKPAPDTGSLRRFALRVTDVPGARAHFQKLGIDTQEMAQVTKCDGFFVSDPDG